MRCKSCDKLLTDYESTMKGANTGEYLDLCKKCLSTLDIEVVDRPDLKTDSQETDVEFNEGEL